MIKGCVISVFSFGDHGWGSQRQAFAGICGCVHHISILVLSFYDINESQYTGIDWQLLVQYEERCEDQTMGDKGINGGFRSRMDYYLYSGDKKHVFAGIAIISVLFGVPWYFMSRGWLLSLFIIFFIAFIFFIAIFLNISMDEVFVLFNCQHH